MSPSRDAWPPLIIASEKPRWLVWRDLGLTLAMWGLFGLMLETEFELFFGRYLERLGFGEFETDGNWQEFFTALQPYVWLAVMMAALLGAATAATLRRLALLRKLEPPPPLEPADEARRGHMEVSALLVARQLRDAVVHVEADGSHRVEPRRQPPTA